MRKAVTLETREQRAKLKSRHEPYWRSVSRGLSIGYRKAGAGTWYVREHRPSGYVKRTLAAADDTLPADGSTVLSWPQVLRLALEAPPDTLPSSRGGLTVRELTRRYFAARRVTNRSQHSTTLDEGKVASKALPKLGDDLVNELTLSRLGAWRNSMVSAAMADFEGDDDERRERQRKAQATADRNWKPLRAALQWGFNEGLVPSDLAWRSLRPYKNVDRPKTRALSVAECRRLLNAAAPEFRPLVRAAMLSGLRYGELCRLRVRDYAHDGLVIANSKTGAAKRTPLTHEGVEFFDSITAGQAGDAYVFTKADGTPWGMSEQHRRMQRACKVASIDPPATFHDLRRTYGSLLVNAKAPLAVIAEALRHSDTRMTSRAYAHLLETTVRTELQRALPRIGPKAARKVVRLDRERAK